MKKIFVYVAALCAAAVGLSASATTPAKSEYFYQTPADKNQVIPEYGFSNVEYKRTDDTGGGKFKSNSATYDLRYEHGLNEMLSLGAFIGYQDARVSLVTGGESKGLTDLNVYLRGTNSFVDKQSLHYRLNFNASVTPSETHPGSSTAATGAFAVEPLVGYAATLDPFVVGAKFSTKFDLVDRSVKAFAADGSSSTNKNRGGNTTEGTIFAEFPYHNGLIGAAVNYGYVSNTKTDNGTGAGFVDNGNGTTYVGLNIYSPYEFSEEFTLIGNVGLRKIASGSVSGIQIASTNQYDLSLTGRFTF